MTTGKPDPADSLWTDFQAEPPDAAGDRTFASGTSQRPLPSKSKSVALGLVTTIGLAVLFFLLRRLFVEFGWSSLVLAAVAMLLGALQGFFMARGPVSARLISSGIAILWVAGAAFWKANRMPWPESAILTILPILFVSALLPTGVVFLAAVLFPDWLGRARGDSSTPARVPAGSRTSSVEVIYDLRPDPQEGPLRERLLELCNQDQAIVDRLVAHERAQFPHEGIVEHLRLAIAHFERDRE